ncbi:phosphatidylinositol 3,4,5-trisphosphate 5-phosphatase 1-like [Asterias amurensis]|uniref:phosphatidylinositol 3,4,5-trisphosphate 5-phosphatase 1-like n=1 Tax=Asterias amurensis TaxID=7602 RepID=UPI003AB35183
MSSTSSGGALPYPWYHGSITRLQTEDNLTRANKTGSFLVRDSESFKGAYVLSVLCDDRIYQYRILPTADGAGYLIKSSDATKQHTFSNLAELIKSYSLTNNGLCCALRYPSEAQKLETEEDQDSDDEPPLSDDDETNSLTSASSTEIALHVLQSRLDHLNVNSLDTIFLEKLREYMGSKVKQDYDDIKGGATTATNLRQLILTSANDLTRQVDLFLMKMQALQQLFDLSAIPSKTNSADKASRAGSDLKQLFGKLGECQARVTTLENKAVATFQELHKTEVRIPIPSTIQEEELDLTDDCCESPMYMGGGNTDSSDSIKTPSLPSNSTMSMTSFEVKVEGALKNTKVKLTVDTSHGNMSITKHSGKDMKEEMTPYKHENIVQLVKSRVNNLKLMIRFSNGKKKEFNFEDAKKRETFCQLIQYMKVLHSTSSEVDQISVFIGTWNMGAAMPPSSISSWLLCQGDGKTRDPSLAAVPHDIYIIGTQEFKSAAISDKDWINRVKAEIGRISGLNKEYVSVSLTSLWGLRLSVLVRPDHVHQISHVRESIVRTGIANTLGNKGAVGVSFLFSGTSFCFINAHLTSGTEKCTRRNNNYHDILRGLSLSSKAMSLFDLTNQFHHMFFLGDLNYRIEWNVPDILRNIAQKNYAVLFDHEQLKREKDKGKIFVDFDEEEITFPPTYRYKLGDRLVYDYKKVKKTMVRINEPSWCDRVTWRSYPGMHIVNTSYGCTTDIVTSDHSAVFSTFDVGIVATSVIPKERFQGGAVENVKIVFVSAAATIFTSMCGNFYLEFYSNCLEAGSVKSGLNRTCLQETPASGGSQIRPSWSVEEFPRLTPLLSDYDYLEEQHILVAIKSSESEESYGEFVVSLRDKISSIPISFFAVLTHQGHKTGDITGALHVKSSDESLYGGLRKTKTYELVSFDEKQDTSFCQDVPEMDTKLQARTGKGKVKRFYKSKVGSMENPPTVDEDALLNPVNRRRPNGEVTGLLATTPEGKDDNNAEPPPLPPPRKGSSPVTPDVVPSSDLTSAKLKSSKELSLELGFAVESQKRKLHHTLSSPGEGDLSARTPGTPCRDDFNPRLERPLPVPQPEIRGDIPATDPMPLSPVALTGYPPGFAKSFKRTQPPGKVLKLLAQFEHKQNDSEKASSESINQSLEEIFKPPLPVRAGEMKPAEDVLIEGLPPPLPAKSKTPPKNQLGDMEEYEVLRRPSTIMEWLMNLGLPQYGYQLLNSGWDNVTYLDTITDKDLVECQIKDKDHRVRMLESIQSMPRLK